MVHRAIAEVTGLARRFPSSALFLSCNRSVIAGRARLSSARRVVVWVYDVALRTAAPYLPAVTDRFLSHSVAA